MALRRRADILDPDFGTIRHQIAKLMQQSIHDCKSFLLMVKSLFPNSIKLEMIEYELMQEYGESSLAAEILCRLYEIHKHLDITQIQLLSNIIKDPSDKVCCEIFSKLIPSLQKDLTQSYFKQISNNLARADSIIFLLNSKDVVLHSQVIPMLLALANQSLLDGEYSMRKSSQMSNTYLRCHSPVQDGESFVKTENSDEGEEGEVIGCDDEDEFVDELDTSNAEAGESSLANIPISALNIFRFKVTYELLPIAYKKLTPLCPVKSKTAIESDACQGVWHDLVKEFRSVYLLLDQSKNKKIHLQNNCCLVPFTRPNIIFVVSKALASSLCAVAQETQDSFVTVRCICLACVLCQVDVMLGDTFHMETPWPSLFPYISEIMLTHWSDVRNRFSRWLLPPTALIFDVGLLNTMFQLECGIGVKIEWSDHDAFLSRCANLIQCKPPDTVDSLLEEFIHLESSEISACLASL
ncbi:unnamed protein product [Heterobilharzia americana]|nr:unnamed protein product [Heterobilharzia americana]